MTDDAIRLSDPAAIPERVMVGMSSSATAVRVLRAGARAAGVLRAARWYAVYVETPAERPGRIPQGAAHALADNIATAQALGATVVRVKASRPADGLIAFARREGVTHVVVGQTARSRLELIVRGSTLDRFLAEVSGAAVQVVSAGLVGSTSGVG
jgi:two-component system sensor histidine kinase KdpD